jgi:hypothetical protein
MSDLTKEKRCIFFHRWGMWKDRSTVSKHTTLAKTLVSSGVEQERRCERCGKLQLRIEWAGL